MLFASQREKKKKNVINIQPNKKYSKTCNSKNIDIGLEIRKATAVDSL